MGINIIQQKHHFIEARLHFVYGRLNDLYLNPNNIHITFNSTCEALDWATIAFYGEAPASQRADGQSYFRFGIWEMCALGERHVSKARRKGDAQQSRVRRPVC